MVGKAAALHRESIVIDGHCDILIAVSDGKMTLDQRVELPDPASWEPPLGFGRRPLRPVRDVGAHRLVRVHGPVRPAALA